MEGSTLTRKALPGRQAGHIRAPRTPANKSLMSGPGPSRLLGPGDGRQVKLSAKSKGRSRGEQARPAVHVRAAQSRPQRGWGSTSFSVGQQAHKLCGLRTPAAPNFSPESHKAATGVANKLGVSGLFSAPCLLQGDGAGRVPHR